MKGRTQNIMISVLTIKLKSGQGVHVNMAPIFHGAMMELIRPEYAEFLHNRGMRPYTQCLYKENGMDVWRIVTLTKDARENIIDILLQSKFDHLFLKQKNMAVEFAQKEMYEIREEEQMNQLFSDSNRKIVRLDFIAPTAFKSEGKYLFYPNQRFIYQSIMNKHDKANPHMVTYEEETLDELTRCAELIDYKLSSHRYYIERAKIPCFQGTVTYQMKGTKMIENLANYLLFYGQYSGVGIKCALGMGNYRLKNTLDRKGERKDESRV